MSKKSSTYPSYVSHSHQLIGANIHQWPQQSSTHGAPLTAIPSIPPLPQLALPAPSTTIWSPINPTHYGFYSTRFSHNLQPNTHSLHSNSCCLANHQQRAPCQQFDNNWSNHQNFNYCLINESNDFRRKSNLEISETVSDNSDLSENAPNRASDVNSSTQTIKQDDTQLKQLKGINEMLKTSLEQTTNKLKETQNTLLKMNEKFAIEYIEKYRKNLKKYGDYIKEECTRFYQNETISKKLQPIVEQIAQASIKAKEEKERIREGIAAKQNIVNEEINANCDVLPFDYNCLPEFPDLLSFYKNVLDEIPLVFLADLSQLKKFANIYIQTKKQLDGSVYPYPSVPSFTAPNIADSPKPDFSLFGAHEIGFKFQLKPSEDVISQSANELPFLKCPSPIPTTSPSFNPLPNSISDPPKTLSETPNNSSISPIGKPLQIPIKESKVTSDQNKDDQKNHVSETKANAQQIHSNVSESGTKQSLMSQIINAPVNQKSLENAGSESGAPKLSQAQSKLLAKLKEKYADVSDDLLIDSITQTKSSLIASGNPKGFSGMKVSDIISKISEYIDKNVITSISIPKSRNSKPTPSFELMSSPNENISQQVMPKGWTNKVDRKNGRNDENCSICFEPISTVTKYETECHHFFHSLCISNWIKKDGSCPICRSLVLPPGEYPEL